MSHVLMLMLAAAPSWSGLDEARRSQALEALEKLPMLQRVARVSDRWLGTPYHLSPLGEGEGDDPDPLLRFDAVDCQTMVEQTMAMASTLEGAERALVPALNRIRYQGAPSWVARNHLVEAQWVPWNVKGGTLADVTRQYAGDETVRVRKVLTPETWREKSAAPLHLRPEHQTTGEFELELMPALRAVELLAKAPEGLVLVVARADRPWLVTRITHMGLLMQGPKGPMLRHASRSFNRVVDEPLAKYIARNRAHGAWTVEGFMVLEPK